MGYFVTSVLTKVGNLICLSTNWILFSSSKSIRDANLGSRPCKAPFKNHNNFLIKHNGLYLVKLLYYKPKLLVKF